MPRNAALERVYDTFQHFAAEARIILIHPESRYRTALVSRLISADDMPVFYYAMSADDIDLPTFISGFTHDIAEQVVSFGTATNSIQHHHYADRHKLLNAFQQDLMALSDEPYLLLFDEFDRSRMGDDLQNFFDLLIDYLPSHVKLVISSRDLPRLPWMSLIAQRRAIMLCDESPIQSDFYRNQTYENTRVEIQGLGPGHVMVDGELVEAWEGHLPRLLLFFALERPLISRAEICASFWPELNTDQAVNVFHVTKRRLHKALDSMKLDVLIHEDGSYRVNPALNIRYDVVDFVSALVEARLAPEETRIAAWQRVIEKYPRPYLQGHSEGWIVRRRQEYQAGYLEAMLEMATFRINENRPESALSLLQTASKENMRRQDIHRRIMQLYAELGRRSEAAGHYQRMQESLTDQKITLEPETVKLYQELMA